MEIPKTAVWKFSKFSTTLILCEINFGLISVGQKLPSWQFMRLQILIFGNFHTCKCQKWSKFRAAEIDKMAVFNRDLRSRSDSKSRDFFFHRLGKNREHLGTIAHYSNSFEHLGTIVKIRSIWWVKWQETVILHGTELVVWTQLPIKRQF